jgi:acetyl esterase
MPEAPLPPSLSELGVAEARAALSALVAALDLRPAPVAGARDLRLPGPAEEIAARAYTPLGDPPFPIVLYFHGGGFVTCDLDTHDAVCREMAARTGAAVLSVAYRLAPEARFPAASDDCLAATRWALEHARELAMDPGRIAVAGDSAGGNLAAVTCLRARDEGGPNIAAQVLLYPVTDYHTPGTPSYREKGEGYGLSREDMRWFWEQYLEHEKQAGHPHASPLRAESLAGLPPALVITAEHDPLRDEGEAYARRLAEEGVETRLVRYPDVMHGFFGNVGLQEEAGQAMEEVAAWLRRHLS